VFEVKSPDAATDDCSVPTWSIPLRSLARAYLWLGCPETLPDELRDLAEPFTKVRDAMLAHPQAIGGPKVFDTDMIALGGRFIAKEGAEGVLAYASIERQIGLAQAVDDGDKTRRATGVAAIGALERLHLLSDQDSETLRESYAQPVTDSLGDVVGELRPGF
jgi:L-asparaginase II